MLPRRWTILGAILGSLCAAASRYDDLPVWKHVPSMVAPSLHVTSQTLSEFTKSKVVTASSPVDLFADAAAACTSPDNTCARPNTIAYGNILFHMEPCTHLAAKSALDAALDLLSLDDRPHEARLIKANVLQLDVTRDSLHHWEVLAYKDTAYLRLLVNQGMNFHVTFAHAHRLHEVVVQLNTLEHAYTVLQHTHRPASPSIEAGTAAAVARPKIATYNVWNVNPPDIVYGHHNRWAMYNKRMDHLVNFLDEVDADIVGLQEVRVDDTFGPVGDHAQIQHIVQRIKAKTYQYVYRPAMSYVNENKPLERIEEGPAVLSKHPIVHSDYMLLSRVVDDPNDSHQRLCLHAAVDVPGWGVVDVYVTHLSLSERAREQTMLEIWEYMQQGKGVTQVLLGDLNAEPQSRGIQFLQGRGSLQNVQTDLQDAWLQLHAEPTPASKDAHDIAHKFTFPSDDPIKRIDFILFRGKGRVAACDVFGQAPTLDTANYPKDKGMLSQDGDSPVYASDHRGVVATFE
ncbi:Aste57867_21787 [Aphanomyces stellatus]|uniref:Aste57867_21787 protein n=1 Tax=Aphanomyces stellatus TaxID=120398 RepID=A0A485LIF7_9STRA|nr:hypothetical protein As57867_021718 [Aphanomyces stellatus]VFT98456.1 Aste57867_21787 [Aphanomyces stellatus]